MKDRNVFKSLGRNRQFKEVDLSSLYFCGSPQAEWCTTDRYGKILCGILISLAHYLIFFSVNTVKNSVSDNST